MTVLLNQLEAGRSVLRTKRPVRADDTDRVDAHCPAEPDAVRAINNRLHGSSLRLWRSRVRDVTRGGDHDAPSARGTVGRALLRRNPRVVPLSLGVPVGVGRRRRSRLPLERTRVS
jgi:hypothetical protein